MRASYVFTFRSALLNLSTCAVSLGRPHYHASLFGGRHTCLCILGVAVCVCVHASTQIPMCAHLMACVHWRMSMSGGTWAMRVQCTHTHTPWLPCTHTSFLAPWGPAAVSPAGAIVLRLRGDVGGSTGGRSLKVGRWKWCRGRRSLMRPPSLPAWELLPLIITSVSSSPGKGC